MFFNKFTGKKKNYIHHFLFLFSYIKIAKVKHVFCYVNLRSYEEEDVERMPINYLADKLHKDSLAFRMLRMHGRNVSPSKNLPFVCLSS